MAVFALDDVERRASGGDAGAQLALAREYEAAGAREDALAWLRRAAAAGSIDAKTLLGRMLLVDTRLDPTEGIRLTMEAAQAGSGEAMHLFAVLGASGRMGTPDWPRVLMFLQRAAEQGFPLAQAELALLADDAALSGALAQGETPRPETWDRLRLAVDLAAWLRVPSTRALRSDPRIGVCESFASPALCHWLIERGRPHLKRARIDTLKTDTPIFSEARNYSSADLDLGQTDVAMHLLRARMCALAGPTTTAMEGSSILQYKIGEHCLPHYDFTEPQMPETISQVTRFGQRVFTILIYLNEDYEGGETEFPLLGWRHKGKTGDVLFFWNVDAKGEPDRQTLHAGLAPTQGEKWLLSQWVRGRVV